MTAGSNMRKLAISPASAPVCLSAQITSSGVSPLHHQLTSSCPPSSRPPPKALLHTLPGARAVAGPVGAPAGTAWAARRPSNARSVNLGSGGLSCLGRGAPAQKGKVGKKGLGG